MVYRSPSYSIHGLNVYGSSTMAGHEEYIVGKTRSELTVVLTTRELDLEGSHFF